MARVTVEDCLDKVDNRFQLVLVASRRARQIALGHMPLVPEESDKPTVVALREIAANLIDIEALMREPLHVRVEPEAQGLTIDTADIGETVNDGFIDEGGKEPDAE